MIEKIYKKYSNHWVSVVSSIAINSLIHGFIHFLACSADDQMISAMLKDSPGSLNFTMFLALLGELLHVYSASSQASPVDLLKSLESLERGGKIGRSHLKEMLAGAGAGAGAEGLNGEELETVIQEAAGDEEFIDYREFVKQLKTPL